MKQHIRIVVIPLMAAIVLSGCSRKGIHMSKHRKSRKCDCPTFTETRNVEIPQHTLCAIYGEPREKI
ncbi:MAG: hypothetical protein IJP80_09145 [Bacteroidales bacterium]|nr:hypothetical protein [Bacteroidales bacterium]